VPGHKNAPLTPEGRKRLCERVAAGRAIAHVAAEAGVSRQTLAKWYGRFDQFGEAGLIDQSSRPGRSPNATDEDVVAWRSARPRNGALSASLPTSNATM
jgi:transposase